MNNSPRQFIILLLLFAVSANSKTVLPAPNFQQLLKETCPLAPTRAPDGKLAATTCDVLAPDTASLLTPATYTYDDYFGYITGEGSVSYTHDLCGNRITRTKNSVTETYTTTGPLNELQAIDLTTNGTDDIAFAYDARGNMLSATDATNARTVYVWNDDDTLAQVIHGFADPAQPTVPTAMMHAQGDIKIAYSYDSLGRCYLRERYVAGASLAWVSDDQIWTVFSGMLPAADFNADGHLIREMIWNPESPGGIGGLLWIRTYLGDDPQTGERLYGEYRPISDHRGNVVALINELGDIEEFYRYDAFGRVKIFDATGTEVASASALQAPCSPLGNPFLFSSKRYDPEAGYPGSTQGLYNYTYRHYDPFTGRFLSPDPLGFVDGPNRYILCKSGSVLRFAFIN